jgi:hypothetical protein
MSPIWNCSNGTDQYELRLRRAIRARSDAKVRIFHASTNFKYGQERRFWKAKDVGLGSLADIAAAHPNVRFTPRKRTSPKAIVMSAKCHVWTAPSWQGSSRRVAGRCSHVFGLLEAGPEDCGQRKLPPGSPAPHQPSALSAVIGRSSYPTGTDSRAVCPHGCFPFLSPNRLLLSQTA